MKLLVISILLLVIVAISLAAESDNIDVFVVPHSHMDPGWEITKEEYYKLAVKLIYDSVVDAVSKNASRRFIPVETAFISEWFEDVNNTAEQKALFRSEIQNGHLEIIGGGWVMSDEAVVDWQSQINQLTLGHRWIYQNLGVKPRFGWSIDPFGHSVANPTLLALCGYNGWVVGRFNDKDALSKAKEMQFIWRGSKSLGREADLFTYVLPSPGYSCPWWMQWDYGAPGVLHDPVALAVDAVSFNEDTIKRAKDVGSNTVVVPFGSDFEFLNAEKMFENFDKLTSFMEENYNYTFHYSTLGEFFEKLHGEQRTWPIRGANDSMPLGRGGDGAWSGFFASRSLLKRTQRASEGLLATAERFSVIGNAWVGKSVIDPSEMEPLRRACALVDHHDAITGTETPHVVIDYMNRLASSSDTGSSVLERAMSACASKVSQPSLSFSLDDIVDIKPGQTVAIVVANPLGIDRHTLVHAGTNCECGFKIIDGDDGQVVTSQVVPRFFNASDVQFDLFWHADVPALGFNTYFVTATEKCTIESSTHVDSFFIENDAIRVDFNQTGRMSSVTVKDTSTVIDASLDFWAYESSKRSGAYIFRPTGPATLVSNDVTVSVVNGPLIQAVHQKYTESHEQVISLYPATDDVGHYIDVQQRVGVIDENEEVVSRWVSDIDTGARFTTDSMGRDTINRYNDPSKPIQGNYYPVCHTASMQSETMQLTSISDSSHGVASLDSGWLETMVHRRPMGSDGKGMFVPVNDTTIVYPNFKALFSLPLDATRSRHQIAQHVMFPLTLLSSSPTTMEAYVEQYRVTGAALAKPLPSNIHLTTLSQIDESIVLRLAHLFEADEDPDHGSVPVPVDIDAMWQDKVTLKNGEEWTLSTLWKKGEENRWVWDGEDVDESSDGPVVINPMQIRTFLYQ